MRLGAVCKVNLLLLSSVSELGSFREDPTPEAQFPRKDLTNC
jgi:hypothetical protein